jgi:hypothetical protein
MITAMNTVAIVLVALAGLAYLIYLTSFIAGDGYGRRAASGLPRSHVPDLFEPRRY